MTQDSFRQTVYAQIVDIVTGLPSIRDWPEAKELFVRSASTQPAHWLLPSISCQAMGGSLQSSITAVSAVSAAHLSIILIDDMLDDDPCGIYRTLGCPTVANIASALQAGALQAIILADLPSHAMLAALQSLNQMVLATTLGQHWDIQNPQDEASYWQIVHAKSSPFFGACYEIGAIVAGGDLDTIRGLRWLGEIYGELVQIQDDLNDVMETPANPDWVAGRSPLPILYAQVVSHPERERFLALRGNVVDPVDLEEAQNILIRCGAVSYCVDQLLIRFEEANRVLDSLTLANQEVLAELFSRAVRPVDELLHLSHTA